MSGGYITQSYGKKAVGMDTIQLEFGAAYRSTPEARKATASAMAEVLAWFVDHYYSQPAVQPVLRVGSPFLRGPPRCAVPRTHVR